MFPPTSDTTEMPVGSITLTSSTPGLGVWFGAVVATSVGPGMFGIAPVRKVWSGVVVHHPFSSSIRARRWYVVDAIIPATRIVTGPPPGGAGTYEVTRPYAVVGPNSTRTCESLGIEIVKIATCGMFGAGVIVARRAPGSVASDISRPPREPPDRVRDDSAAK